MKLLRTAALTRLRRDGASRRGLLRGAAAAAFGLAGARFPGLAAARNKKKRSRKKRNGDLCLNNGSRCRTKGGSCQAGNCLQAPFTIEARWSNPSTDHDTYLFVPNAPGASLPFPLIDYLCRSADTGDGGLYPFAFVSRDAQGPGDEVTTVASLMKGKYEYWIELDASSPTGDLTVALRNKNGRVVRSWSSPAHASAEQGGWHVFDIQGEHRSITSIDQLIDLPLPIAAHDDATDVCQL